MAILESLFADEGSGSVTSHDSIWYHIVLVLLWPSVLVVVAESALLLVRGRDNHGFVRLYCPQNLLLNCVCVRRSVGQIREQKYI